jgi:hypothetical protein
LAKANSGGKTGFSLPSGTGCGNSGCHGAINTTTTLSILEAVDGKVMVDNAATITLTLRISSTSGAASGCNISAKTSKNGLVRAGALSVVSGSVLKLSANELTHSSPRAISNGHTDFPFNWQAPPLAGTFYLHASGNAVNLNGNQGGDKWNFLEPVQLVVAQPTSVQETPSPLTSIWPMPAHDVVTATAPVAPGTFVTVRILNAAGEAVRTDHSVANSDSFVYVWDGRSDNGALVPSGMYSVAILNDRRISTGTAIITR